MEENKDSKELRVDTICLLRAVMKISSALNDIDTIALNKKYYKYKFKKLSSQWVDLIMTHTSELMKSLADDDSDMLMDIYKSMEESCSKIHIENDDKTAIILFYIKLKSSLWDIDQMKTMRNTFYPTFLHQISGEVIDQLNKQYKDILLMTDDDGKGVDYLIDYYNDFGQKIMFYAED